MFKSRVVDITTADDEDLKVYYYAPSIVVVGGGRGNFIILLSQEKVSESLHVFYDSIPYFLSAPSAHRPCH